MAGDFNVHFNTSDANTLQLCDLLDSFGIVQTVYEPTRGLSCLDNIFSSTSIEVCRGSVVDIGMSDHRAQLVEFKFYESSHFIESKTFRPITNHGQCSFYNILADEPWTFISDEALNPQQKFDKFILTLEEAYISSFPEKTYRIRSDQNNIVPWFNDEIKAMRDYLGFLRDLKNQYNCVSSQEYSKYRAMYKKLIKNAKVTANDNHIRNSNNPTKTMWSIINKNKKKIKRSRLTPPYLLIILMIISVQLQRI